MSASTINEPKEEEVRLEQPVGSSCLAEDDPKAQTLLVVEDEEALREVEAMILRRKGFQVLDCGCVAEALELVAGTAVIDLLLTDRSLPDGNGLDLARRFRELHPQAPVILASGSLTEAGGNTDGLDRCAVLQKPFQFGELLELICALLAETTRPIQPPCPLPRPNRGPDAAIAS